MSSASAVRAKAQAARAAALALQAASDGVRMGAVEATADALHEHRADVLRANREDLARAKSGKLASPILDRLKLDEAKLAQLLDGVRQVAALPDPVGRTVRATRLDDGLELFQVTVPIGVVGVVFESRPDALVQISALTLRSGNAALLKGGREADATNRALAGVIRDAIGKAGVPSDAVQLLEGRAEVDELLSQDDLVDLVIPRGSTAFVRHVMDNTRIPVLGHAEGVCHIYVDAKADLDAALAVCLDGKLDYPAACNAVETILVHRAAADRFVPKLRDAFGKNGVEIIESADAYGKEFGDLRCGLRVVSSLDEAIEHVNRHGSRHTDVVVTEDKAAARAFVSRVDAAGVFVNASPRFADGYRYGLGAEVGVSTSKVHARGPVGLEGLTTTKWVLVGEGQKAGDYQGPKARPFKHETLDKTWDETL